MAGTRRMREVLAGRAAKALVGRQEELRILAACVESREPVLAWIHGLAGIGKSALVQEFSVRAARNGQVVIRLDCRSVEPTPEGLLFALERVLNTRVETVEAAAEMLSDPTVLVFDNYEVLRLLDGWLRQEFIPALKEAVRVVICGRYPPTANWRTALEWQGLIRTISLSPLNAADSAALLERAGVPAGEAVAIGRIAHGHPLALVLAAGASRHMGSKKDTMDSRSLVQQLTQLYLADVKDPKLRSAVEAASVVRRTTHSLLAAMVPEIYTRDLYEQLAALSIGEATSEGWMMHEPVQEAVASWLRSSDPHRFHLYRRAAFQQIRAERAQVDRRDLWRHTADMLFLVETPGLREAYFPSGIQSLAVEPARPADQDAILAIAQAHETPQSAAAISRWWRQVPDGFSVMRDAAGEVAGFYIATDWRGLRGRLPADDPALVLLQRHLRDRPLADAETALFLRRWLSKSAGEAPSAVQAACWLDVKRSHMALRPRIRRCYGVMTDIGTFGPMLHPVGFRVVDRASIAIDGVLSHLVVLDFGPGSFDGWLGDLVARDLGLQPEEILDTASRELITDDERVALTALEFGVLDYLRQREGKAVSRAELLQEVWEQRANSGSNVIDVVVRSLRGKLGARAWMVSTVRGVGYRFQSTP